MEEEITNDFFTEEEYGCTFVAGYTSWGFPYGTTIEEPESIKDNEELPEKENGAYRDEQQQFFQQPHQRP